MPKNKDNCCKIVNYYTDSLKVTKWTGRISARGASGTAPHRMPPSTPTVHRGTFETDRETKAQKVDLLAPTQRVKAEQRIKSMFLSKPKSSPFVLRPGQCGIGDF